MPRAEVRRQLVEVGPLLPSRGSNSGIRLRGKHCHHLTGPSFLEKIFICACLYIIMGFIMTLLQSEWFYTIWFMLR